MPRLTTPITVYDGGEGLAELAVERLQSWGYQDVALLEGLGFGERFVRTALFRLNKEEWLDVVRIGRRSFYRLSD